MIFALSLAWANPEAGLHAVLGVGSDGTQPSAMVGGGAHAAIAWVPRVHTELRVNAGPTIPGDPWVGGVGGMRFFLRHPGVLAPSVFAGGGVAWTGDVEPLAQGGLAVDTGRSPGPRARFELVGAWVPGGSVRALLSAGAVFGRGGRSLPEPEPQPVDEPEPQPEPPVAAGEPTMPDDGMVWLPGPVCQWLPPGAASAEMARLGLVLASYSVLSDRTLRAADGAPPPTDAPRAQGRLLVAASAGDRVTVGDAVIPVRDGVATVSLPEGPATLEVLGGGRLARLPVAVIEGNALWVAPEPPAPARVQFAVGRADLEGAAQQLVAQIGARAGDWSFRVSGSASPEGRPEDNAELARRRAETVRDALIAAGVPAARVTVVAPEPLDPSLPAAQQRGAFLVPVEAP